MRSPIVNQQNRRGAALRRALLAYSAPDGVQEEYRRRMLQLCDMARGSEADPFTRSFFGPGHFTASAFIVSRDLQHLLLIRHEKLQMWLQPGGHIEVQDEDVVAAALREVREETGLEEVELLSPLFDIDIHTIPARTDEPAHEHHDVRVLLMADRTQANTGGDQEAMWFSLTQLAKQMGELHAGLRTDHSVRSVAARLLAAGHVVDDRVALQSRKRVVLGPSVGR